MSTASATDNLSDLLVATAIPIAAAPTQQQQSSSSAAAAAATPKRFSTPAPPPPPPPYSATTLPTTSPSKKETRAAKRKEKALLKQQQQLSAQVAPKKGATKVATKTKTPTPKKKDIGSNDYTSNILPFAATLSEFELKALLLKTFIHWVQKHLLVSVAAACLEHNEEDAAASAAAHAQDLHDKDDVELTVFLNDLMMVGGGGDVGECSPPPCLDHKKEASEVGGNEEEDEEKADRRFQRIVEPLQLLSPIPDILQKLNMDIAISKSTLKAAFGVNFIEKVANSTYHLHLLTNAAANKKKGAMKLSPSGIKSAQVLMESWRDANNGSGTLGEKKENVPSAVAESKETVEMMTATANISHQDDGAGGSDVVAQNEDEEQRKETKDEDDDEKKAVLFDLFDKVQRTKGLPSLVQVRLQKHKVRKAVGEDFVARYSVPFVAAPAKKKAFVNNSKTALPSSEKKVKQQLTPSTGVVDTEQTSLPTQHESVHLLVSDGEFCWKLTPLGLKSARQFLNNECSGGDDTTARSTTNEPQDDGVVDRFCAALPAVTTGGALELDLAVVGHATATLQVKASTPIHVEVEDEEEDDDIVVLKPSHEDEEEHLGYRTPTPPQKDLEQQQDLMMIVHQQRHVDVVLPPTETMTNVVHSSHGSNSNDPHDQSLFIPQLAAQLQTIDNVMIERMETRHAEQQKLTRREQEIAKRKQELLDRKQKELEKTRRMLDKRMERSQLGDDVLLHRRIDRFTRNL